MKQYNGEKAIISLTSWKGRIKTVGKTIFSLLKHCPDFHIVLVLSEEEFKNKEQDLPNDLNAMVNANLLEILWVYKNYKSFKKILFTMQKYPTAPIISADDGCIYLRNYAEELYKLYLKHKCAVSYAKWKCGPYCNGESGTGMLFPPNCFKEVGINALTPNVLKTMHDDGYYGALFYYLHIKCVWLKDPVYHYKFKPTFSDLNTANKNSISLHYKFKNTNKIFTKAIKQYLNKNKT